MFDLGARKAASLHEQQPASSASVSASAPQPAAHAPVGSGNNDNQGAFSAKAQWLAAFLATRAPGEEVLFRQIRNQHESDKDVTLSDEEIVDLIEELGIASWRNKSKKWPKLFLKDKLALAARVASRDPPARPAQPIAKPAATQVSSVFAEVAMDDEEALAMGLSLSEAR